MAQESTRTELIKELATDMPLDSESRLWSQIPEMRRHAQNVYAEETSAVIDNAYHMLATIAQVYPQSIAPPPLQEETYLRVPEITYN